MFYKIKKNSISNYPNQEINCVVLCTLHEEDTEEKAVYWIPYKIPLQECLGLSPLEIDEKIRTEGERLFNLPEYEPVYEAIELGNQINAPEVLE